MKKLLYTPNIGYDMSDWEKQPIEQVFAGVDCIMALTSDGRALQKTVCPELAVRTKYWTRIRQIAISKMYSCAAIGLVSDGTCLISKRALRSVCDRDGGFPFERINNTIKRWSNIRQVAVSDAYFALDYDGFVHVAAHSSFEREDYREVEEWTHVRRIVTGSQNSVLGITEEGKLLCAGANLRRGPMGDLQRKLAQLSGVVDVFPTGSECEEVVIALEDGTVRNSRGEVFSQNAHIPTSAAPKVLDGNFWYTVCMLNSQGQLEYAVNRNDLPALPNHSGAICSFAVGSTGYEPPFVLAVADTGV